MEQGETRGTGKRRRGRLLLCVSAVVVLITICAVVLGVTLAQRSDRPKSNHPSSHDLNSFSDGIAEFQKARSRNKDEFKNTFLEKCQKFKKSQKVDSLDRTKCEQLWDAFQKAYVKKDPCEVPMEDYEPLMTLAPIEPLQDKAMFWSKTKDVVHDFTGKTDCFVTVEDSLLGSVLDGLTWCGKEGSSETLTTGCPDWNECPNNTVSSFWKRISTAFADAAKGDVTVMLNGSITKPFDDKSIFASVEVERLKSPRIKNLKVVLVADKKAGNNCKNGSLKTLQEKLKEKKIKYDCKDVPQSQVKKCSSNGEKTCGSCW
ncbi:ADP-ribosyl cyclase/cyclic ADP-ribose hydrolase 1-like isoform 1-T1 [Menidia menidia]